MTIRHPKQSSIHECKFCHVCGKVLLFDECSIHHDGYTQHPDGTSYFSVGGLSLHPDCATVLAMRLINDVMQQKASLEMPRVVDILGKQRRILNDWSN